MIANVKKKLTMAEGVTTGFVEGGTGSVELVK